MVEFADTGGAGYVDLSKIVANDIQSNKGQPALFQCWPDLLADPVVTFTQLNPFTSPARGDVAACFTRRWDTRQGVGTGSPSIIKIRLSPALISGI